MMGKRTRLASAGGEGAPFQCCERGPALPVLGEMARLASAGERTRLASAGGEGAPCQCCGGEGAPCQC